MPEPREFAGPVPRSSPALAVGFSVERNLAEDPRDVPPVGLVWKNRVLPAGFEPASEARKAPILDRTRLRERGRVSPEGHKSFCGPPCRTGNYKGGPRFDKAMRRPIRLTTESVFLICGLLIVLMGWVADLFGVLEAGEAAEDHGGGNLNLRIFVTMFGVAFATIGVGFESFSRMLGDPSLTKRYLVAFLFLADGSFHLYAFNDHLAEAFPAAFFAIVSTLQLAAAFLIPYSRRELDPAWLGLTAFLLAAYVVTRTFAVWPIGTVEEIDSLGLLSKAVEVVTVLTLVSLIRARQVERRTAGDVATVGR